jgi:hypothetical protein
VIRSKIGQAAPISPTTQIKEPARQNDLPDGLDKREAMDTKQDNGPVQLRQDFCNKIVPHGVHIAAGLAVTLGTVLWTADGLAADHIDSWLEKNLSDVVSLYRDLHRAPELSLQEKPK